MPAAAGSEGAQSTGGSAASGDGGAGGTSSGGSLSSAGSPSGGSTAAPLYTQQGRDQTWQALLDAQAIPLGTSSTMGVTGSLINVNDELVETGPWRGAVIEQAISIHTVGNSVIPRRDFAKWSRWYQEDGGTQVFRLFEGETNVRNTRAGAARIEAFSSVAWSFAEGKWHEWKARYTIVKPLACAIFQAKNAVNDWGIMLNMTDAGDIVVNHRRNQEDVTVAKNMTGKSFDIRVRDNGRDYEVFFNEEMVGEGYFDRPEGKTGFRWGMYKGGAEPVAQDAMIFVTGATVDP